MSHVTDAERGALPPLVLLEVRSGASLGANDGCGGCKSDDIAGAGAAVTETAALDAQDCSAAPASGVDVIPVTWEVASRVPYVVAALATEWRPHPGSSSEGGGEACEAEPAQAVVQVFLPPGCPCAVLRALVARLATEAPCVTPGSEAFSRSNVGGNNLPTPSSNVALGWSGPALLPRWKSGDLAGALQLVQVASMLQVEELLPELVGLVRDAVTTPADVAELEAACGRLELPPILQEAAATARRRATEPSCLPDEAQVRGMIASALLTADGKVWRVVQKVIDRREAWPRTAKENAAILLAFAKGAHGSIRATPHTGFFWGSRDFLYLVCRYVRCRPEHFDEMVSAMFDSVYSMDPELPAEIIDAVFKELLSHEGLSFSQCEHVIAKLMQREDQLGYLFHEWSGVFPSLPACARRALSKGLLPTVGRCPHAALDFVLKELDSAPLSCEGGRGRARRRAYISDILPWPWIWARFTVCGDSSVEDFPPRWRCSRRAGIGRGLVRDSHAGEAAAPLVPHASTGSSN